MNKLLLTSGLFVFATTGHAATFCGVEVSQAIEAQIAPNLMVSLPDMNNDNVQSSVPYVVDVVERSNPSHVVAAYSIVMGETCQVQSGPTLVLK